MWIIVTLCLIFIAPAFFYAFLYGRISHDLLESVDTVKRQRTNIRSQEEEIQKLKARIHQREKMISALEGELIRVDTIRKRTEEGCLKKHQELEAIREHLHV